MDAPSANFPHKIESSKNTNLFVLDKNIAYLISGYLTDRALMNVCCVSKNLHNIFSPSLEKRLMSIFLKYVVEGRLDKVEEILNKNPKLVFLQGDITDLSGRVFTRITAFQYATWALDKEMWELILKYLPEVDAYGQLIELEQKRPDITQVHGTRLNFAPLLDAYQKYTNNYDAWYATKQWEQLEACWCKEVGGAQRQMPAWFVYVFCEKGKDKAWPTNDFKKSFTRDSKHLSWWFDQEHKGGKVGLGGAPGRGRAAGRGVGRAGLERVVRAADGCGGWAAIDRLRLNSCQVERTSCRGSLSDYLKRTVIIEKSPGMVCKIL